MYCKDCGRFWEECKCDDIKTNTSTSGSNELLPCPFCGYELPNYEGLIMAERDENDVIQHPTGVSCSNCGCYQVGGETIDEAIKAWNTRTKHTEPQTN